MSQNKDRYNDVDRLLSNLFTQSEVDLKDIFESRIAELKLSQRAALAELDIEVRALKGMLNGTQKMVDLLALSRLADFLQLPIEKVVRILLEKLEQNFNSKLAGIDNQEFILKHFDLVKLKKCGFIDSINDFSHIEERILKYFSLKSIQDYGKEALSISFSDGKPKSKTSLIRDFWVYSAFNKLRHINNPYDYDKSGFIEYVPSIRWHTRNVENGLSQVIRELYKLGVTVIFEPYISTLYARGAMFAVNGKPCIVLTNYTEYYPSLWFALIHEIFHVIFDFDKMASDPMHISEELDKYAKREVEADEFAREFLFPDVKLKKVSEEIGNQSFVEAYAKANQIHKSIIYANYCWQYKESEKNVFGRFLNHIPKALDAIQAVDPHSVSANPRSTKLTAKEWAKELKKGIFNGL